ncbi:MAG: cupredoxin domain-containing protein [Armatimonadota bacterium]
MRIALAVAMVVVSGLAVGLSRIAAQEAVGIDIRDFAFEPRSLSVRAGTAVRWVNRDDASHSIAMDGGRPGSSGTLGMGGEHTFVFREAGRFAYHCGIHPTMLGEVTVAAP